MKGSIVDAYDACAYATAIDIQESQSHSSETNGDNKLLFIVLQPF